jgi:hypothetical protein
MDELSVFVEDIFGEFGFRVVWETDGFSAKFKVYEITGRDNIGALFNLADWRGPFDKTPTEVEAEVYLDGFIKWDGCTEVVAADYHWCGPDGYQKHQYLLYYLYNKAFELMGREPEEKWNVSEH